uniref:ribonuclease Z n=1 Tax=Phallusia mammillata TaxID=59560 RepID=A0A6F9DCE6_9ASCI|nr:zinc phosphodiesterase ELAC protein 2-like [Phallusia mammillata]
MLLIVRQLVLTKCNILFSPIKARQISMSIFSYQRKDDADFEFRLKWSAMYKEALIPKGSKKRTTTTSENTFRRTKVCVLKCGPERMPSLSVQVAYNGQINTYYFNYKSAVQYNQSCNLTARLKPPEKLLFTAVNTSEILSCFDTPIVRDKIVTLYGPKGLHDTTQSVLRHLTSALFCEKAMGKLVFNELHSNEMEIKDNNLNIKMIKIEANKIPRVCYILTLPNHYSEVDKEKCKSLGIDLEKVRTDFSSLEDFKAYKEFVSRLSKQLPAIDPDSETTIYPEDVCNKSSESKLLIIDCPTPGHLGAMLNNPHLSETNFKDIKLVAHMVPKHISSSYHYQKWLKLFDKDCVHLWLGTTFSDSQLLVPDRNRMILHQVDPVLFPFHEKQESLKSFHDKISSVSSLHDSYEYHITDVVAKIDPLERFEKLQRETSKYIELLDDIQTSNADVPARNNRSYPRLVVLGCGGTTSTTERSGPCFLIQTSADTSILMDCTGLAYTQLYRHFGAKKIASVLSSIKVIFISHRHLDHCSGLPQMLYMMKKHCPQNHVNVILPAFIKKMVWTLTNEVDFTQQCTFLPTENLKYFWHEITACEQLLHLKNLLPVKVDHGVSTHGLVLSGANWKIVYSSDTLPMNKNLTKEGCSADLLIHDSLYLEDRHRLETQMKRHSVRSDAIRTAHAMKAKNVLLTHFSASYPVALPIDLNDKGDYKGSVMYAMDNMELTLDTVSRFPQTHETLQKVFADKLKLHQENLSKSSIKTNNILESFKLVDGLMS